TPAPRARATHPPPGRSFSPATPAVIRSTHARPMAPAATRTIMSAQQHPRQYIACDQPRTRLPRSPPRQWPSRNPSGLRHAERHACLRCESWNAPAASRLTATPYANARGESAIKAVWARYTGTPETAHTARYTRVNTATGTPLDTVPDTPRCVAPNRPIIAPALGSPKAAPCAPPPAPT